VDGCICRKINARISVIIPNYNRETLVGDTISNLLSQTLPPQEIIVVDDGSTDKSVEVIRSFGDKIKLIRQANQGPGAARNAGLRIAMGEFVQFQDSDDLYSLNKLEVQAKLLEETGADIAFSPWVKLKIEGRNAVLENHVLPAKNAGGKIEPALLVAARLVHPFFRVCCFAARFWTKVGFYRTDLMIGEDGELFFRALTSSPHVAFAAGH